MFKQHLLFLQYAKNIECIIDKNSFPICKTVQIDSRQHHNLNRNMPLYEPYIPRGKSVFYNCTTVECKPYSLTSIIQLSQPTSNLKDCFLEGTKYVCETVKYHYYKNIDKLLFLANNIPTKIFYLADCLLYSNGDRLCHRKSNSYSHAELVHFGTLLKPNMNNILSQDEIICEETDNMLINCDRNLYVPYYNGLKQKTPVSIASRTILKTGSYLVPLKHYCKRNWCGYSGKIISTRRFLNGREHYEPPGGSVYRCYYAKKQQVCKKLYGPLRQVYNERDWLSS